jgi:hypothetical protein
MRRLFGVVLAGAILMVPAFSQSAFAQDAGAQGASTQQAAAPQKFTISGDLAVLTVSVKADKTADYESVINTLKEVLAKSEAPEAKQQAAGWKVVKSSAPPQADGTVLYMHFITPVAGADYGVMANIYAGIKDPMEVRAIYDKYVATGAKNLGLASGTIVVDLGK